MSDTNLTTTAGAPIADNQDSLPAGFSRVGNQTDVLAGYSTVASELGAADLERLGRF
jgi:catalase